MSDIICYIYLTSMLAIGIFGVGFGKGVSYRNREINEKLNRDYSCDGCVHRGQNPQRCKTCKRGALDRHQTPSQYLIEHHKNIQE